MRVHFAYLASGEDFDAVEHAREDELIFDLEIGQIEEEFAEATVEVEARPDGYLRAGRRVAISVTHEGQTTPLLIGEITGAPIGIRRQTVRLVILGRRDDWEQARDDLIEQAAVAPWFDPLFVPAAERRDQAQVLSARGASIAWDRVTGEPKLSDLIDGGRTIELLRVFQDSVSHETEGAPPRSLAVVVRAGWSQDASVVEEVDWAHGRSLEVVADKALREAWPRPGVEIGGNWRVRESELTLGVRKLVELGQISGAYDSAIYGGDVPVYPAKKARVILTNPRVQAREEVITLLMRPDLQPVAKGGRETLELDLRDLIGEGDEVDPWSPTASYDVGDRVFYSGVLYEANSAHTAGYSFDGSRWDELDEIQGRISESFFETERGQAALAHAVERGKARLRYAARNSRVSCDVPLEDVLDLKMGDRASFEDPHLPGGRAEGKVISYRFVAGSGGSRWATVELGCVVGRGGADEPTAPDTSSMQPPSLGPQSYPCSGRVSPVASAQIEELRKAPDAYDVSIRVEMDAPPVPVAPRLSYARTFDLGSMSLEKGIDLE